MVKEFQYGWRLLRTAAYLQPRQLFWRLRYAWRKRYGRPPELLTPNPLPACDQEVMASLRHFLRSLGKHWLPEEAALAALCQGEFTYQHFTLKSDAPEGLPPWAAETLNPLWRYQIQYFEYARDLALAHVAHPAPADGARLARWMRAWIAAHPPGSSPAWDPYPTARRIMNWALAIAAFGLDDPALTLSLHQQAQWLEAHLEFHIGGNHLINNAVGLILAGALLEAPFARRGLALLHNELNEQILPDGGHYERSLLYHCQVLEDLLLAWAGLPNPPEFIEDFIKLMLAFLQTCRHPDNDIPLFGDAVLKATLPAKALLAVSRDLLHLPPPPPAPRLASLDSSGYYLFGLDEDDRMILKAGPPGPRYLLGHAHGDCFSFELSIRRQRVIVDSGVHGYAQSPHRDYHRSTRAHNTVQVNDAEQLDYWADFRVARRYRLLRMLWGNGRLRASHDGFWPFVHHREVWTDDPPCWIIRDQVTGPESCRITSRIHFHPAMEITEAGGLWRIQGPGVDAGLRFFGQGAVHLSHEEGGYAPEFGLFQTRPTLIFERYGKDETPFGYTIFPDFEHAASHPEPPGPQT